VRCLEFLLAKHCKELEDKPVPRLPDRKVLLAIPKVAVPKTKSHVTVTDELHDAIYIDGTTTRLSTDELAAKHGVSPATVWKIVSRRHQRYSVERTERFRLEAMLTTLERK
jgi:hypothetical protein